ncbi:MAG: SIR2 family protein [Imperialibacter sp.]|uniref:SIR2 family protein n=1 Tax=Imperialibacter sp. TaxID=2038411 RepID=UPI0032EBBBE9
MLNVLLGAGFSYDAGVPLVNGITPYFDRDLIGQLCRFSDSQWRWFEFQNDAGKHNGRIYRDPEVYEFVLNELITAFKQESGSFTSYEHFLSFLLTKDEAWFKQIGDQAKAANRRVREERNIRMPQQDFWDLFDHYQVSIVFDIINYLVADCLRWDSTIEIESHPSYLAFTNFIKHYDEINIFTLNHDLLLEALLNRSGIEFSDGFSREGSDVLGSEKQPLPVFQNEFSTPLRIIKLHGSKDHFAFEVTRKEEYFSYRTGERIYFKKDGYYDLHRCTRVDLDSGETIQDFNSSIVPQFLTGSLKEAFLKEDCMYKELIQRYEDTLAMDADLLVVGYSFCDPHIDKVLQSAKPRKIYHVDPYVGYKFGEAHHFRYLHELDYSE